MAAITTRLLHLRPVVRPHSHSLRHFSSSSDDPEPKPEPKTEPTPPTQTPYSSYLNDVKASLQRETPPQNRFRKPLSFSNPNPYPPPPPPPKAASYEEIRRNLSEFRRRSAPPPPPSDQQISFQELYKRNVISRSDDSDASPAATVKPPSLNSIRDSLRKIQASAPSAKNQFGSGGDPRSMARFKESLKLKPEAGSQKIIGGSYDTDTLPSSIFRKEESSDAGTKTTLLRSYQFDELGMKLKMLRPDKKKGKSFSLQELNDRLASLRDIEEKESQVNSGGLPFTDLRDSLVKLKMSQDDQRREKSMQRLDVFNQLGGTPSYMLSPPKEHLVDKYFHPDNMSSAEKLKLELKKVRDEFKMSETDCGSARVQVAQLTTKIKHLSSVLQKKDKHSRKGLQAMVQRRKKLLKYLRRTDWDSYSLVLSKLGLRDNPDIKA